MHALRYRIFLRSWMLSAYFWTNKAATKKSIIAQDVFPLEKNEIDFKKSQGLKKFNTIRIVGFNLKKK